ncbi:piwi-like protein 1 [Ictalurus punctatus]|uniref:Piwi-like protein 1 n=1 Tax=Ictalurus punctatus TaxID=7998 RepID=A0A9F7R2Q1_ICTPU|nr:piwi-like protein 1 [Ictalurus punctatus]XP_053535000.1 piwi-like protein 1 [Ictalurus punctatus]
MTSMPLEIWLLSHTRRNADVAHSLLQTLNKVPVGIHLQRPGMMEYDDRQEALLRALQQRAVQQVQMLKHLMILVSTATTTVPQERDPSGHWWPASTRACPDGSVKWCTTM